ncbi:MAG TPA: hypothetical protein VHB97_08045, partial [Polyangia bacterium]|nr:hypothetical protein [Polyangia bacterium]
MDRRLLVWLPLVALAVLAGVPLAGEHIVRAIVLPKVAARLGRAIMVNDLRVGFGTVEMRGFVIDGAGAAPPLVVPALRAKVQLSSLLGGGLHVEYVDLDRPRIDVVRSESGDDNVSSILDELKKHRHEGAESGGGSGGGMR